MKKIFGNKKLLIIILSAIVLVGIAVAIVLICFGDKEEDPYQMKVDEFKQLILDPENADGLYDGMKAVRDAALAFGDDAMDKLGYVRQDLNNDGKEELFIGCFDDVLNENNFSMMLSISRGNIERTRRGINNFCGGRVGGIIFGPLFDTESYNTVEKILPPEIPTIFFNSFSDYLFIVLRGYATSRTLKSNIFYCSFKW